LPRSTAKFGKLAYKIWKNLPRTTTLESQTLQGLQTCHNSRRAEHDATNTLEPSDRIKLTIPCFLC